MGGIGDAVTGVVGGITGANGGKGKGGEQPSIPEEFKQLLPYLESVIGQSIGESQPFLGQLPGLANVNAGVDAAAMRNSIAMGLAPYANVFGDSAAALSSGLAGGFSQLPQELINTFSDHTMQMRTYRKDDLKTHLHILGKHEEWFHNQSG